MGKKLDLIGLEFGDLIVLRRLENKGHHAYFLCKCKCGNEKAIRSEYLKNGKTKNCRECFKQKYEFKDNCVIGYTSTEKAFYFDLEDYEEIRKHTWRIVNEGYVQNQDGVRMHRLLTNAKKDELVDHINHQENDNRKSNLRICTAQENNRNTRNTKGYYWNKRDNKYMANIKINGRKINLGYYDTEEEARFAYCKKAIEEFGEFVSLKVREDYEKLLMICIKTK